MATYVPYEEEVEKQATSKYIPYTEEAAPVQAPAVKGPLDYRKELGRQLGLTARLVPHIWGTATALSDPLVAGVNALAGTKLPLPSQATQQVLDRYLPKPEGALEKGVQFFGGALASGLDPLLGAAQAVTGRMAPAPQGFIPPSKQMPADNATSIELHQAGIKLLPTQIGGGPTTRSMQGAGGVERINTLLRSDNQPAIQALAAKETGLPPKNLTDAALNAASRQVSKETYKPIKDLGTIYLGRSPKHPYNVELDNIVAKYDTIDQAPQLLKKISSFREQKMPAEVVLERIAQLRSDASGAFADNHRNYGKALREIADALENQIERNIRNPAVLEAYRAGRTQIAKNNAVKEMLVDKSTGIIDTTKAHKMLEDGIPLTGGLQTIAKAGSPMYSAATRPPLKGEGTPFNWGDALYSTGFGGAGFLLGGGPMGAVIGSALPPIARSGARHAVASRPIQSMMARSLMERPPSIFGAPAARVAAGMPPQLLPLFGQGEQ